MSNSSHFDELLQKHMPKYRAGCLEALGVRDLTVREIDDACSEVFHRNYQNVTDYERALADAVLRAAGVRPPKEA